MVNIENLVRKNVRDLKPYSSARDEYQGEAAVFLDANENPFNQPYNRYPDPLQRKLKDRIAALKGMSAESIFLGNGSDEAIDILFRIFCEPGKDNIVSIHPTYGMYPVCAGINDVEVRYASLTTDFEIDPDAVLSQVDKRTKLIFLCSPNNPTANSLDQDAMLQIIRSFQGIVVLDEAYIDFAKQESMLPQIPKYNNLVLLQTFSKAWGLAGVRLGMAFAAPELIAYFNKVKYPYNVNVLTQKTVLEALGNEKEKTKWVATLLKERERLINELQDISFVKKIYPSDANFVLVRVDQPEKVYAYLVNQQIIVRDRSRVHLCEGCLRITIGTTRENDLLLAALTAYREDGS